MPTRDYAYEAQQAAEKHLAAIEAAEELSQEGHDDLAQWPPMAGPWCGGCDTCFVRETLFAAWPLLLQAARAEISEAA